MKQELYNRLESMCYQNDLSPRIQLYITDLMEEAYYNGIEDKKTEMEDSQ